MRMRDWDKLSLLHFVRTTRVGGLVLEAMPPGISQTLCESSVLSDSSSDRLQVDSLFVDIRIMSL
jgi:hypothetical protein